MRLINHSQVGKGLAEQIALLNPSDPVVIAVGAGGVRIGWEIASRLGAPLDVAMVTEVTIPGRNGPPVGYAVDGHFYADTRACREANVPMSYAGLLGACEAQAQAERETYLHCGPLGLEGTTVILVSDGTAEPRDIQAAARALRDRRPEAIVYAVPVAPPVEDAADLRGRVVALYTPEEWRSVMLVNAGYQQTTDDEIARLVASCRPGVQRSDHPADWTSEQASCPEFIPTVTVEAVT